MAAVHVIKVTSLTVATFQLIGVFSAFQSTPYLPYPVSTCPRTPDTALLPSTTRRENRGDRACCSRNADRQTDRERKRGLHLTKKDVYQERKLERMEKKMKATCDCCYYPAEKVCFRFVSSSRALGKKDFFLFRAFSFCSSSSAVASRQLVLRPPPPHPHPPSHYIATAAAAATDGGSGSG
jgi:hypothetical protein